MKQAREAFIMRLLPQGLIVVFVLALLPFFIQSLFNHPAPWDDYSVALLVKERGYWGFYVHFLQHWNGRYVSTLLQGLNPLAFDSFHAFRFVPMVFMGGFIAAFFYFMRRFWQNVLSFRWLIVAVTGYCALFFAYVRSSVELWYWYSSSVVYATAFIAVGLLLATCAPLLQGETLSQKESAFAATIAFLLPGISEAVAISMLAFCGCTALAVGVASERTPLNRQRALQWLAVCGGIAAGLLLYMMLHGTHERLAIHPESFRWQRALIGLQMQLPVFASWAANGTLWIFTLLAVSFLARAVQNMPREHFLRMPPLLMTAITLVVILAAVLPYYLATGFIYIFVRIENVAFFWFLFFWFANLACWADYLQRHWQIRWDAMPAYAMFALLLAAIFKLYSPNTKVGVAWLTLLNGDALRYEREHQARYRLIERHKKERPNDTLLLSPINTHMELLMFEELTDNPNHRISNKDFAKYFGITAVKVE